MFRRRNNIVKQAGKRFAPNNEQLKAIFKDFFSNLVDDQQPQKQDINLGNDSKNKQKRKPNESYYRDKLAKFLNGQTEVIVPTGRIDILTRCQIIEVKHISNWKAALGQIIVYGNYYPHHQKRLHLFGENNDALILLIVEQCKKQNVIATFETF